MRLPDPDAIYPDMASRLGNQCRCHVCGGVATVDPSHCLRSGWPVCCGVTMRLLPTEARND